MVIKNPQICSRISEFSSTINFWQEFRTLRQLFFENPSIGSKVMKILVLRFNFFAKKAIFGGIDEVDDVTLIFEDKIV